MHAITPSEIFINRRSVPLHPPDRGTDLCIQNINCALSGLLIARFQCIDIAIYCAVKIFKDGRLVGRHTDDSGGPIAIIGFI